MMSISVVFIKKINLLSYLTKAFYDCYIIIGMRFATKAASLTRTKFESSMQDM